MLAASAAWDSVAVQGASVEMESPSVQVHFAIILTILLIIIIIIMAEMEFLTWLATSQRKGADGL